MNDELAKYYSIKQFTNNIKYIPNNYIFFIIIDI